MSSRRQSPGPRRTPAIKRADGEPLTRADIQYDILHHIFTDTHRVFTDPYPLPGEARKSKLSFRDLYIKSIANSPKSTKALRDKMSDSPSFAEDFAMLGLLVNVGRINTTMSFFPEMKTTIRTYHPIPSLQRTNGNLQDAPRIKHILKTGLLEDEAQSPPTTPLNLLSRIKEGHIPSTSVTNLIFILSNHTASIGQTHFAEDADFTDLFIRTDISSVSRARAFLWLCFNYLEGSAVADDDDYDNETVENPFADSKRDKAPSLVMLTPEEAILENIDSEEEKLLAEKLVSQRMLIVKSQSNKEVAKSSGKTFGNVSTIGEDSELAIHASGDEAKGKKRALTKGSSKANQDGVSQDKPRRSRAKRAKDLHVARDASEDDSLSIASYKPSMPTLGRHIRRMSHASSREPSPTHVQNSRYAPYSKSIKGDKRRVLDLTAFPPRTMLEHAWSMVVNKDPLVDSDDDVGDAYDHSDYLKRLKVISRLRGKAPTPDPAESGVDLKDY
ncbi:hypothetical protein BDQ17DRAFT_1418437 [Cyathus striatus]|nr:hypothetical protein BDQ17DRAFT_1418437 [Cyathus striatus]